MRENKEVKFYKQPGGTSKRKELMTVTFSTQDRKGRAQETFRSSERVLAEEQPNPRNINRGGFESTDEDVEEM